MMIVTDELLEPYRTSNGNVIISSMDPLYYRTNNFTVLPDHFFTDTLDAFPIIRIEDGVADKDIDIKVVVVLAFTTYMPRFREPRTWLGLQHQAGGYLCEQWRMLATTLKPRPEILSGLQTIARQGFSGECCRFSRSDLLASRFAWYVRSLDELKLDCECTWRLLSESFYPINATQANLDRIASDAPDLAGLCDWSPSPWFGRPPVRYDPNPVILFMTENSD